MLKKLAVATVLWLGSFGLAEAAQQVLTVGVEDLEYYPLWAIRDGEYVGTAREILDAFAQDQGYQLRYQPLPIKRLYAELAKGGIDLKFPDNREWAPEAKAGLKVAYSDPVITYVDGVMVRPINLGHGVDALRVLGTVSGFTPYAWQDRVAAGSVVVKENPRLELLLKQSVVGLVDGAYVSVAVAHYALASRLDLPGALVFDPALPHSRDHYALSSVSRPDVVEKFNDWLRRRADLVAAIKQRLGAENGVK